MNSDFKNELSEFEIYISSNGVHTNMIVPLKSGTNDWNEFLKTDKSCNYLAFGWGDKEFYMNTPEWSDLKAGTAFKAVFFPTEAVMQVYCISAKPSISKRTKRVFLNAVQYDKLTAYIYHSFETDDEGNPIELIPEKGLGSLYKYYKAKGKYTLFFTCNNWTGRGLKRSGVKNSLWAPFDKSVLYYLN